jgi:hypothetical protein
VDQPAGHVKDRKTEGPRYDQNNRDHPEQVHDDSPFVPTVMGFERDKARYVPSTGACGSRSFSAWLAAKPGRAIDAKRADFRGQTTLRQCSLGLEEHFMSGLKQRSSAQLAAVSNVTERDIAERAYRRWLARGCPISDGSEDWFAAEAELQHEIRLVEPPTRKSALRALNRLT